MTNHSVADAPSRGRWLLAILIGTVLWALALAASFVLPQTLLGLKFGGATHALSGALQLLLGAAAIYLACRAAGLRGRDIGVTGASWRADVLVGLAVAVGFALLQFGLIIPLTGGAQRSDVVANLGQLQGGPGAVAGLATLSVLGAIAEEMLFRGLLLHGLAAVLGGKRAGWAAAVVMVTVLFGAQPW